MNRANVSSPAPPVGINSRKKKYESGMFIHIPYPWSWFFPSQIPDPPTTNMIENTGYLFCRHKFHKTVNFLLYFTEKDLCRDKEFKIFSPKIPFTSSELVIYLSWPGSRTQRSKKAVFRIRIHFLRIRIRIQRLRLETNTDPDTDLDQDPIRIQSGSRALMTKNLKKITAEKKNFFLIKNCNLPIPRPP